MKQYNTMQQKDSIETSIKITTNENRAEKEQIKSTEGMRKIMVGSNVLYKTADEIPSQCNPDNGAFFEGRSNPLSSKGN